MSKIPLGPHPPQQGNFWEKMGWKDEDEYEETLVAACGRCASVEILDDHREEKLCFDCWWKAREAESCFYLRDTTKTSPFFLGGDQPTGHTKREADERVLDFEPGLYEIVLGSWAAAGRLTHNGYMNRRRRAIGALRAGLTLIAMPGAFNTEIAWLRLWGWGCWE